MVKRIVIAFSDSGGGHRSGGEAIMEALSAQYGERVQVTMVDVLKRYAPPPVNRTPVWYPHIIRYGAPLWGASFWLTNGPARTRFINTLVWPYVRRGARRFLRDFASDVVVSVHPLLVDPLLRACQPSGTPFVTVVTDLVSGHVWWYHRNTDLCLVPTEPGREAALRCGIAPERVAVTGLPVAARFSVPPGDKAGLKAKLGWRPARPTVLVVGGGEGMGPVFKIARAVAQSGLNCDLAIVAGRNQALFNQLQGTHWELPAHIYGFVHNMPDMMRAADVLVTKAGPGTLSEAFNAGLPMILYNHVPGQEAGNVGYVVTQGAGVWAPRPQKVVAALRHWLGDEADPCVLQQMAANARRLARPNAAREIAQRVWALV
jgi:1,2-diacylglycerol 3-beta-galactosyltransferase